jgi:molecular chaperone DnaK (HSP70)
MRLLQFISILLFKFSFESLTGKKNQSVNPDEVAVWSCDSSRYSSWVKDILLLDVTPLSLGVETLGGVMTKIMLEIPQFQLKIWNVLNSSWLTNVEIHILQGERELVAGNKV